MEGESWRWMLGVEAIPAFIYFVALVCRTEKPKMVDTKIKFGEIARKILIRIGGKEYAQLTIEEIQRGIAKKEAKGTVSDLFSSR